MRYFMFQIVSITELFEFGEIKLIWPNLQGQQSGSHVTESATFRDDQINHKRF